MKWHLLSKQDNEIEKISWRVTDWETRRRKYTKNALYFKPFHKRNHSSDKISGLNRESGDPHVHLLPLHATLSSCVVVALPSRLFYPQQTDWSTSIWQSVVRLYIRKIETKNSYRGKDGSKRFLWQIFRMFFSYIGKIHTNSWGRQTYICSCPQN